ncbi:hypothetical protein WAI453_006831 [Rhynchosporium graminicola]
MASEQAIYCGISTLLPIRLQSHCWICRHPSDLPGSRRTLSSSSRTLTPASICIASQILAKSPASTLNAHPRRDAYTIYFLVANCWKKIVFTHALCLVEL